MKPNSLIIFVCEHGAAKSIIAATYFNKLANEKNLNAHAIARGTNPDVRLSPTTIVGLRDDGLVPTESAPQNLTEVDIASAERIIFFCELPAEFHNKVPIQRWENVPPVSENYEKARDAILEHLNQLLRK